MHFVIPASQLPIVFQLSLHGFKQLCLNDRFNLSHKHPFRGVSRARTLIRSDRFKGRTSLFRWDSLPPIGLHFADIDWIRQD